MKHFFVEVMNEVLYACVGALKIAEVLWRHSFVYIIQTIDVIYNTNMHPFCSNLQSYDMAEAPNLDLYGFI